LLSLLLFFIQTIVENTLIFTAGGPKEPFYLALKISPGCLMQKILLKIKKCLANYIAKFA
jgi:hypothetical protein